MIGATGTCFEGYHFVFRTSGVRVFDEYQYSYCTDAVSGRIIGNVILPEFKAGRFELGIVNRVNAMIQTVQGEFEGVQGGRDGPKPDTASFFGY
jgi:hypothetical protein